MNMEIIGMRHDVEEVVSLVRIGKRVYGFVEGPGESYLQQYSVNMEDKKGLERLIRESNVSEDAIVLSYFNQDLFMDMYQQLQEASVQEIYHEDY